MSRTKKPSGMVAGRLSDAGAGSIRRPVPPQLLGLFDIVNDLVRAVDQPIGLLPNCQSPTSVDGMPKEVISSKPKQPTCARRLLAFWIISFGAFSRVIVTRIDVTRRPSLVDHRSRDGVVVPQIGTMTVPISTQAALRALLRFSRG
ncbi:hypothetical protein [Tardiphaga robiniae]|uniref:hypothetical protein n=1 Tax=Tardiphaga robiniae TaxID=943830 RepID=UPI0011121668|nr:hypothetical protein [Tardiphaga robiniae]